MIVLIIFLIDVTTKLSEKFKIKVSVANRVYPLNATADQEEGIRRAAKKIEDLIRKFEQSYSVQDKQDVLAMCALQFASQVEQMSIDLQHEFHEVEKRLEKLNHQCVERLGAQSTTFLK